jgi:hypothetical protein
LPVAIHPVIIVCMTVMSNAELADRLQKRDFEGYQYILKSHAENLYTVCHHLCLTIMRFEKDLFSGALRRAVKDVQQLNQSQELWLYSHLHKEWLLLAKKNKGLQAQEWRFAFDWSRQNGRQAEDSLEVLNPLERAVFLYRFTAGLPFATIQKAIALTDQKTLEIFETAVRKITAT